MMKNEILQRLVAAQNVLDTVSVSHKNNWRAMIAVANLIDEITKIISDCEVVPSIQKTAE